MSIESERRSSGGAGNESPERQQRARRDLIEHDLRAHIRDLRARADELELEFDKIVEARLRGDYDKRHNLKSDS